MNKNQNDPDLIAQLDQQETALENMANLLGGYYKQLRFNGVPKMLASELVLDYQRFLLEQSANSEF